MEEPFKIHFYQEARPILDAGIWFKPFEITLDEMDELKLSEQYAIERMAYQVKGMQANMPEDFESEIWIRFRARPSLTSLTR